MGILPKKLAAPQSSDNIIIYLSPNQLAPPAPPFELQRWIPRDTWNARIPLIVKAAAQFQMPYFERAWFFMAVLSVIVLPVVLYRIILEAMNTRATGRTQFFFEAKAIAFAIMLGTGLLFYAPIALWKFAGNRRVAAMVSRWAREDRAALGSDAVLPTWKVRTPGVFGAQIQVTISVPPVRRSASFGFAQFPANYINAPVDAYKGTVPPVSVVNGMPVAPVMSEKGEDPFKDQNPFEDKNRIMEAKV